MLGYWKLVFDGTIVFLLATAGTSWAVVSLPVQPAPVEASEAAPTPSPPSEEATSTPADTAPQTATVEASGAVDGLLDPRANEPAVPVPVVVPEARRLEAHGDWADGTSYCQDGCVKVSGGAIAIDQDLTLEILVVNFALTDEATGKIQIEVAYGDGTVGSYAIQAEKNAPAGHFWDALGGNPKPTHRSAKTTTRLPAMPVSVRLVSGMNIDWHHRNTGRLIRFRPWHR